MRQGSALRLVAAREMQVALHQKTTWVIAILLLIGSSAAMIVPEVVGKDGKPSYDVVVVGGSPSLRGALRAAVADIDARVALSAAATVAEATRLIDAGEADVGVVHSEVPSILARSGAPDRLVGAVAQAIGTVSSRERLLSAGLTAEAATSVLAAPDIDLTETDAATKNRRTGASVLSFAMYVLLYALLMQVATGTAIEKANRISEVLLGIVRPVALLFGKVLGVACVAILVMLSAALPVAVKAALGGELPIGLGGPLAGGAAWFVLGIGLYLVIAGALGALADRQEEVGSLMMPLNLILIASYFTASADPESGLSRVLAYVPLSSPMVMPSRIAVGAASGVEMAVSLILGVLAVGLAMRFGSVVYRRAIVRTGRRLKLSDVLRAT